MRAAVLAAQRDEMAVLLGAAMQEDEIGAVLIVVVFLAGAFLAGIWHAVVPSVDAGALDDRANYRRYPKAWHCHCPVCCFLVYRLWGDRFWAYHF